ncbi:MAG TPA: N-acetyl-gamma-glutamyl-phosphate reductase [Verrucomicrobiae bacterium]|nr:N-acetyl-gamma-glutamyl-phosphate reductase [Verrucomicrobiae bacterium]
MKTTKAAIVGASGYSGQELIRLLLQHPHVEVTHFTSRQYAGQAVADVFPRFRGQVDATFVEPTVDRLVADVAFLALPHGVAAEFAPALLRKGIKVLDLSADFRLKSAAVYQEFYEHEHPAPELLPQAVYGLPELHRDEIRKASLVACPGCYPTSIILGVAPALKKGLAKPEGIVATSLSGVSGAGRKVADEFLFTECNESVRAYGIPKHRHLSEIEQELSLLAGADVVVSFAPHLVPLNRGIVSTIYLDCFAAAHPAATNDALAVYREFYDREPFVRVTPSLPDTKNVEATNYCDVSVRIDPRTNRLIVVTAIDNLTKGAAGQAVQCLNLVCGYEETAGLL